MKSSDKVPDSKTIWKFREPIVQEELVEALFFRFNQVLDDQCFLAKNGELVDAGIVEVSRKRNSRDENVRIKVARHPKPRNVV